jgi:hypothetical protein
MSVAFLKGKRVGTFNPDPLGLRSALVLLRLWLIGWRFGSIGCTASLTLAGVLALATIVTGLTSALTLTGILAFTSVLFGFVFVLITHSFDASLALVLVKRLCLKLCTCARKQTG